MHAVRGLLALLVVLAVGCSTTGRELHPPRVTAPPQLGTVAPANRSEGTGGFALTSPDFTAGGALPADAGETSGNRSPGLAWHNVPPSTAALALVVTEPATGAIHWSLVGIAPSDGAVATGAVPPGATELATTQGTTAWLGPRADPRARTQLVFTLYALAARFEPPAGADPARVRDLIIAASSTRATISGWFLGDGATLDG
jgi:phosphatidylethanolamine-binding protein (PEBP) family uncharacterized protein